MSTYEISKSSLVSLKAEILRKHQELAKAKTDNERKIKLIKKNTPLEFKNKNSNKNEDTRTETITESEEVQDLLKKSRLVLEHKSALYERLRSGQITEEERRKYKSLLVHFNKTDGQFEESDEEPDKYDIDSENDDIGPFEDDNSKPTEKWVDYVDCLGRTRTCLQKDLDYLKSKDKDLEKIVEAKKRAAENNSETVILSNKDGDSSEETQNEETNNSTVHSEGELLSSDMRRELLRQQWEKEEDELRKKSDVHYQDVLFGEARTHGVGYYGFSKNEEERLKQQDALKQLREETEQKQKKAQELKMMRDKVLAARIKAAKDRRRARLGLPPEEEKEEEVPEDTMETKISVEEKRRQLEVERQKEEKEKLLEEARKHHLRPWDVGKDGITTEHHEMSQEEWNEMKRSERVEAFAPPTSYTNDQKIKVDKERENKRKREKKNKEWRQRRAALFQGNDANRKKSGLTQTLEKDDSIVFDSSGNRNSERQRGAEIPPPMKFDYFGPTSSKVPRASNVKNDINESIEAGLRFLRNQIEQKKQPPKEVFYS